MTLRFVRKGGPGVTVVEEEPQSVEEVTSALSTLEPKEDKNYITRSQVHEAISAPYVGKGVHRMVFQLDDKRVIKVETKKEPRANEREVEAWTDAPADLKAYLVPLCFWAEDHRWVVQEYAHDVDRPSDKQTKRDLRALLLKPLSEAGYGIGDFHAMNVGVHQGYPKIRDYGAGIRPVTG